MRVRREGRWILLLAVLTHTGLAIARREPFALEQVMSVPFPSESVAALVANMVAWVFDALGLQSIWVAAPVALGLLLVG